MNKITAFSVRYSRDHFAEGIQDASVGKPLISTLNTRKATKGELIVFTGRRFETKSFQNPSGVKAAPSTIATDSSILQLRRLCGIMSGGGRGGALSTDPFESILATARGIGFDIPEPENSVEDVQCASFMANLLQLVESGGSIPDLKSALTLLERNRVWDGLYDIETIRGYTRMLQHMSSLAVSLTKQRLTLANKLTSENAKIGIPVELEHQNTFKQLIRTIARDK